MLALQITSTKTFMQQLLGGEVFDIFLLKEAVISTANTFTLDGRINPEFYPPEERGTDCIPYEFQPWNEMKGLCYHLIKGKNTPLYFKFVFHLKPEKIADLLSRENCDITPQQVRALVLTVKYDGSKAVLTTGTSYHTFIISKDVDILWDKTLTKYLSQKEIAYELLQ